MNAQTLVQNVEERYTKCLSYQDRGRLIKSGIGNPASIQFATAFKRPAKFRFCWSGTSWLSDQEKYTILSHDGKTTAHYEPETGVLSYSDDVRTAILRDGINSWHAAEIILQLLTADFGEFSVSIKRLDNCRLLNSDEREESPYYLLEGTIDRDNNTRFWVRQSDFAIIRVSIEREFKGQNRSFDEVFPGVADKYEEAVKAEIRKKWEERTGSILRTIEFTEVLFDCCLNDRIFEQSPLRIVE